MKLGFGLYRHHLNTRDLTFARQAGATHVVVHLVDYFKGGAVNPRSDQPTGGSAGWGLAGDPDVLWGLDELIEIKAQIESAGLEWYAIENLDPAHWHDVLLAGPKRAEQLENIKTMIRTIGEAGIPVLGYNFSLAGVPSRTSGPYARGGAIAVGLEGSVDDTPIPLGMVWNMIYDPDAPAGFLETVPERELWERWRYFLESIMPTAEEAGVTLAAHPDDPPAPIVRRQHRLLYQPAHYRRLIDLDPSPHNKFEFCLGTLAEMTGGDLYEAVDEYSKADRIAYIHFRNVRGKVPNYKETFIDEGDSDLLRIVRILKRNRFDGVLIPDHAPQMSCDAPWHAGMAFSMGYMQAVLRAVESI